MSLLEWVAIYVVIVPAVGWLLLFILYQFVNKPLLEANLVVVALTVVIGLGLMLPWFIISGFARGAMDGILDLDGVG